MSEVLKGDSIPEESGIAGKGCEAIAPLGERLPLKEIERSIIKKYRKDIWSDFIKGIKEYEMISRGDRVAVAISGGKDSLLMAKLLQELCRHGHMDFELEFIAMDPGYHDSIRELLIDNCNYLDIPLHLFEYRIFDIVDDIAKDYPCYMCAKMRRGALYAKAKELGCNKLALGHHFNDVIETTLINMFYAGSFKTMLPKLKSTNFEGIELIRPMYKVREENIEKFIRNSGIWPLNCACMVAAKKTSSKREEVKNLIKNMKKDFNNIDKTIFKSAQNVNLDSVLGWEKDYKKHSYLDFY